MGIPLNIEFKSTDYTKNIITNGLITAVLFSSFIYFEHFGLSNKIINTLTVLISYYLFITLDKKSMFFTGFFISILWFWWIGMSFIHYDLVYLIPVVIIGISAVYAILFYLTAYFSSKIMRVILLASLNFIEPLGFNWLKLDLPLINTYFNTYFNTYESKVKESSLNIYMPKYNVEQSYKWDKKNINDIVNKNLAHITYAVNENYDLVILPETVFPININDNENLMTILRELSRNISIVTGGLSVKDGNYYNSTYMFENGNVQVANKVVLVPFGEAIPAPKFIRDLINKYFFNGASDYSVATEPTTFTIKGEKFRNAICYEVTSPEIYDNLDTDYIIATSNNAWFTPSIEPTLQKLLIRYYAKKNKVIIYHSANKSKSEIVK